MFIFVAIVHCSSLSTHTIPPTLPLWSYAARVHSSTQTKQSKDFEMLYTWGPQNTRCNLIDMYQIKLLTPALANTTLYHGAHSTLVLSNTVANCGM
jgi:hypothetical protein